MHNKPAEPQSGLTLIELLITIAVLAIVAAISVPVVTNVVSSSQDRALEEVNKTVDDFLANFSNGGAFLYSSTGATIAGVEVPARTFVGMVDLNGNGLLDPDEAISQLTLDNRWMAIDSLNRELVNAAPSELKYPTTTSTITDATVNVIER